MFTFRGINRFVNNTQSHILKITLPVLKESAECGWGMLSGRCAIQSKVPIKAGNPQLPFPTSCFLLRVPVWRECPKDWPGPKEDYGFNSSSGLVLYCANPVTASWLCPWPLALWLLAWILGLGLLHSVTSGSNTGCDPRIKYLQQPY